MSSYEPIDAGQKSGYGWCSQHWKQFGVGTFIFLLLIGFTLFVILALPNKSDGKPLMIDDLFNSSFVPKSLAFSWLSSPARPSTSYTTIQTVGGSAQLLLHDAAARTSETLLDSKDLVIDGMKFSISQPYTFTTNMTAVLFPVNKSQIFRHSFHANYLVYTFATKTLRWLDQYSNPPIITNAQWNPANGNIAYVKTGNVWIQDESGQKQITNDGDEVIILNGIHNWVYEEEVFADYNALRWSPDGQYLVYLKSNQSMVPTFSIPFYEDPNINYMDIKYPKAGQENPSVELWLYDVANTNASLVFTPSNGYITSMFWNTKSLVFTSLNRFQNRELTFIVNASSQESVNVTSKASTKWIETRQDSFVIDHAQLVHITNNTGYFHIALLTITPGPNLGSVKYLTSGEWDVAALLGYSPQTKLIYFLAYKKSPIERHLYSVTLEGAVANVTDESQPGWYNAQFNSDCSFYFLDYQGPEVPTQSVISASKSTNYLINDNRDLVELLKGYRIPKRTYWSSTESPSINGFTLRVENGLAVPILFSLYGGPGSQRVTMQWTLGFDEVLTSNHNLAIITVDPVGTGGRGIDFLQQTYLHLGVEETKSLIKTAKWVQSHIPKVTSKMGIWGWSFGGFMSLNAVTAGGSPITYGVSVAPVTDWKFYDTFYTEKFMRTPQDNPGGYASSSLLQQVKANFSSQLLLIHGTGDDNVHFQHSAELNKVLVKNGIQYDTMLYTNRNHAISEDGARPHLYHLITNWLETKFLDPTP